MLKDFTVYKYLSSTAIFLWGEEGGGIIKGRGVGVSGTFGVYTCMQCLCKCTHWRMLIVDPWNT